MSQAALASMYIASRRWYCSLWLDSERNYHTFRLHASEKNTTELFRVILWSSSSNVFFCSRINTRVSLNVIAFIAGRNPNLIESLRVLSESSQTRSLLNDEYGGVCCEHVVTDNVVEFIQLTFNGYSTRKHQYQTASRRCDCVNIRQMYSRFDISWTRLGYVA